MNFKTDSHKKLISIGIPARNEERFIGAVLDSLLAQDYPHIELIVSDNNSSDATGDICQMYASRDRRVRYYKTGNMLGSSENFNRAAAYARGEYYMWSGAHDLWDKSYIGKCAAALERDPSLVMVFSDTLIVDKEGRVIDRSDNSEYDTTDFAEPSERFSRVMKNTKPGNVIHGLMRREALNKTRKFTDSIGPDRIFLAELSFWGKFFHIKEPLFHRRQNRSEETSEQKKERWLKTIAPNMNRKFPYTLLMGSHLAVIKKAPLPLVKKAGLWGGAFLFFGKPFLFELFAFLRLLGPYRFLKRTLGDILKLLAASPKQ